MVYISRKEHFNAAHKLYNPKWSEDRNREVFGACANKNWHGHNFELIITVKGKPDPDTGFVADLKQLSKIIQDDVIEHLDHKNLNIDVDFMRGKMASCENVAIEIWKILHDKIFKTFNAKLHCVKLVETRNNFVEYFGEE